MQVIDRRSELASSDGECESSAVARAPQCPTPMRAIEPNANVKTARLLPACQMQIHARISKIPFKT